MRLKLLAAAAMGAALIAPACATAGEIIESASIPTANVPFNYPFSLKSFDTSLGTLESVEFVLMDSATASVLVQNDTGTAQAFTGASASIPLTVTGPGALTVANTVTATVASGSVAAGALSTYSGVTGTQTATTTYTDAGDLAQFELNPLVNLSYLASAGAGTYAGTANPDVLFGGTASAGGTFELIYNYASVPEPGTWAFLMLGVGAIGVAMRRRKDGVALAAA